MSDPVDMTPTFWCSPDGISASASAYYEPARKMYPDKCEGWKPLFTAEQMAQAVADALAAQKGEAP